MSLEFKCPKCGMIWPVGPNIERNIRDLRLLLEISDINVLVAGERKCNGCGRVMTIEEIIADAYDPADK